MNDDRMPKRARRFAFILSGIVDSLIGAAILLIGFGILPVDVSDFGLPGWLVIGIGALMALIGATVAIYNFSRLEE